MLLAKATKATRGFLLMHFGFAWVSTIPGLWTGLDHGLDSGLDRGLTAIRTLINRFHYNITVLPIYTCF